MLICYHIANQYVIEKLCLYGILSNNSVTITLCSSVTMSSKTMSLWHSVSNTPVAHDISFKVGTDALVCPPIYPYMASR